MQFFCIVSTEIVHGCGGNKKLFSSAGSDAIRGVFRDSANKTRTLSILQRSLDWSDVVMTQAVCGISLITFQPGSQVSCKMPDFVFVVLRKYKVLCEKFFLFCLSDLWVRHGAVVQQWLPAPGLRWRGHQGRTYSKISCEWLIATKLQIFGQVLKWIPLQGLKVEFLKSESSQKVLFVTLSFFFFFYLSRLNSMTV